MDRKTRAVLSWKLSNTLDGTFRLAALRETLVGVKRLPNHFDLMISTVPRSYPMQQFLDLLKLDSTLVNVGAVEPLEFAGLNGMAMAFWS